MTIHLQKMTEKDFQSYIDESIPSYAGEKMKSEGLSEKDALKVSEESFNNLLPQGLQTHNNFLFTVLTDNNLEKVGILWFAKKRSGTKEYAFIYDIELKKEFRGRGYGIKAIEFLEKEVQQKKLTSIRLHVFAHNETAIGLYNKSGFKVTNQIMAKSLEKK